MVSRSIHSIDNLTRSSKRITFLMISVMAVYGFLARFISPMANLVDSMMIGISLIVVTFIALNLQAIDRAQRDVLVMSSLLTTAFIWAVLTHGRVNTVVEYVLFMAYLVPLFVINSVSAKDAYNYFLCLFVVIAAVQFPFDVLFQKTTGAYEDSYAGTFLIANDKSRYLFMLMLAAPLFLRRFRQNRMALLLPLPFMLLSFLWGDSLFTYLFGAFALLNGLAHNRKHWGIAIVLCFAALAIAAVIRFADLPFIYIQYNRYLDPDHGVVAAIRYALETLISTGFMGTGFGEFSSRTSQSLGGLYLPSIPRTMVTFGTIADQDVTPGGFPSYLSLIAETGVFGVLTSIVMVRYLYRMSHKSRTGYALFTYVLLLSLYSPIFFEKPDGIIFLYSYLLLSKALHYLDQVGGDRLCQS